MIDTHTLLNLRDLLPGLIGALLVPNVGETLALGMIVNKTTPQDLSLRLYKSNTTPAETDTDATYTDATFSGYAPVTLTGATWTLTAGAPSSVDYPQQTFTCNASITPELVYGYRLRQVTSTTLLLAERFPVGPYSIANNGDNIQVTPHIEGD